jgi:PAS domain S-box-containing protein/putative nucleotidyltransferase with HDIG domain
MMQEQSDGEKHGVLQSLYDASPDMIFVLDGNGRIIDVNENTLKNFGVDGAGEFQNLCPSERGAEGHTSETAREKIRLVLEGKKPDFEWTVKRKNGETFPVEVRLRQLDARKNDRTRGPRVLAIVRDISERKKAEARLAHYTRSLGKLLDVSQAITATTDLKKLYRSVIAMSQDLLSLNFSTVMILSEDKQQLIITDTLGFPGTMIDTFSLVGGQGLSTYVVQNAVPATVADFATETRFDVPPVVTVMGITSAVCVPMMFEGKVLGVLIGHTSSRRTFTGDELCLYQNIANQSAVAIQNSVHLIEQQELATSFNRMTELITRQQLSLSASAQELEDSYISTVKVLAAAIDARDPFTLGHSTRVAKLSVKIGEALGLSRHELEDLEVASLFHDVGKLKTPDFVLLKEGSLSPMEYREMSEHPEHGAEILSRAKSLQKYIPAVRHHHEWYNGKGYPDGLRGEDIPLHAAIIAVTDSFDAMTSSRPYKNPRSHEDALRELVRCSGVQFAPRIVEVFLEVIESPFALAEQVAGRG